MKNGDIILLMLSACVTASILITIIGIVLKGKETNEHNITLRSQIVDLIKVIAGAVIGAATASN